jgi:glucose-1-phosphatase
VGEITSDKQWQVLSKLKNGYQDSLFTSAAVAQNVAKPLVKYIDNALVGEEPARRKSRCWWGTTRISPRC